PRPPQARLAKRDDTRSPLKDEPGWARRTPFPNFGKVEYFSEGGLTASQVFCPSGNRDAPRIWEALNSTVVLAKARTHTARFIDLRQY
ncbi:hypothetical protein, partial [Bradyrhizobium diazoefficiens]|uniref:hypothetical protein n=1 Tax=Bradyrhizobium diazoefficiens TaxID=1355477 RepID=UPI001B8BA15C